SRGSRTGISLSHSGSTPARDSIWRGSRRRSRCRASSRDSRITSWRTSRFAADERDSADSYVCPRAWRGASPHRLLLPREIDVEILPVRGVERLVVAEQPWLHEIILETEDRRNERDVGRRDLGRCTRCGDAPRFVGTRVKAIQSPIVFGELEACRVSR